MKKSGYPENSMVSKYKKILDTHTIAELRKIYEETGSIFSIGCPEHLPTIEELEETDLNPATQKDLALLERLYKEMEASKLCQDCRILRAAVVGKIELLLGNYDNY